MLKQCPFCKIDFKQNKWASANYPKVICLNCRWYHEAEQAKEKYEKELQDAQILLKKYKEELLMRKKQWIYDILYRCLIIILLLVFAIFWIHI